MLRTYDKIRRYGDDDVQGIEHGEVSVFPKIDGTCSIVYLDQGTVKCASRNCELTAENHNQHFYDFVQKQSTGLVSLINEFGNAGFGDVALYGSPSEFCQCKQPVKDKGSYCPVCGKKKKVKA